ncbi:ead/Ea22-like family protein [Citrobacter farmeri]|uniref:ead/Ea22-like family protein n=1 Tax=Citrobacter farmeri TaxID=67824 RepID=UPI002DBE7773|nr:ead/Ea22-like family protein [Citrobacter farmeri]MEC3931607.1 ead/Ea22-like family protein [Citrobacter farmeri]
MNNIDKQALRKRYSEKPAPKCHLCGAVMSIQAAGAGGVTYGCTGRIDKNGEGYKFAEGRHFADDHYARSRVTDYSPSGDPEVLALLDDLEVRDKQIAELVAGRQNLQWMMGVYVHAYEEAKEQIAKDVEIKARLCLESNSLFDRLRDAEKCIAKLEALAKSVKFDPIPMEELGNKSDGKKHPYMFGAGYNSAVVHCESVMLQSFAAAGIGSQPVSHRDELPQEEIECDICGHVSTDPEGRHHCSEDNSND